MSEIPEEAVRLAAEAIEDVAIRRIGRDLGTVYRDEIVEAGLRAALPVLIRASLPHGDCESFAGCSACSWDDGYATGVAARQEAS